jgi:peptidoglycan/LPS O-acetylase OafA/YrhL
MFWWADRYQFVTAPDFSQLGSPAYYTMRVLEQLSIVAPPIFLFVSGFFVAFAAGREATNLGWRTVGGRLRMLLPPYVLWSLAIFVGRAFEGSTDTPTGYLEQLLVGGAAAPFYFIPLLTQFYLVSPLVVPRLKDHPRLVLAAAAGLQLGVQLGLYPVLLGWSVPAATWIARHSPGWFIPQTAFWFVLGGFAGFHLPAFRQWLMRWKPLLPWLACVLGLLAIWEWELLLRHSGKEWLTPSPTVLDSLFSCAVILTLMAYAQSPLPMRHQVSELGERSYGVYLLHAPVLELLSRTFYHVAPACGLDWGCPATCANVCTDRGTEYSDDSARSPASRHDQLALKSFDSGREEAGLLTLSPYSAMCFLGERDHGDSPNR